MKVCIMHPINKKLSFICNKCQRKYKLSFITLFMLGNMSSVVFIVVKLMHRLANRLHEENVKIFN